MLRVPDSIVSPEFEGRGQSADASSANTMARSTLMVATGSGGPLCDRHPSTIIHAVTNDRSPLMFFRTHHSLLPLPAGAKIVAAVLIKNLGDIFRMTPEDSDMTAASC